MSSQQFEATCSHCGEKVRVAESMVNLYQKCRSCSKTFHVVNIRAIRPNETPWWEREQSPAVRLAIRVGLVLTVLLLLIAMRRPLARLGGNMIYGSDTAELRSWYAEIEPGMTGKEVYQHLRKMPQFGEFASAALVSPEKMAGGTRDDWIDSASTFEGIDIGGSMLGSGTRNAEGSGESAVTRIHIDTMRGEGFGMKYPGTSECTASTEGHLMQVNQEVYIGSFRAFVAAEWRFDFRLSDKEEMGRRKLRFYFKGQSGGATERLERVEKSGF